MNLKLSLSFPIYNFKAIALLKSLLRYIKYFLLITFLPERKLIPKSYYQYKHFKNLPPVDHSHKFNALLSAVTWLITAQKATVDNGFGSYHLVHGWSSSYPETTGYIIPTLLEYARKHNQPEAADAAVKAADFLVDIQKISGGWQGGRVNENRPEIVFNTGQVTRGMLAAFQYTGDKKYLVSAIKAGEWLALVQHPEGFWKTHALMEQARVYDTFVDVPLLQLYETTGEIRFRDAAVRNLEWVVNAKMRPNGWFEDCDNTIRRNDKPILHTIAYTLDGLVDSSTILKEPRYLEAAINGSSKLLDLFLRQGILNGRYDSEWIGREYFICTGGAQMAIVWMKLYREGHGEPYLEAARKMNRLLIFIQARNARERDVTRGAIPGSFPLWGRYEPFAYPNWAAKFFCDALLLEEELNQ